MRQAARTLGGMALLTIICLVIGPLRADARPFMEKRVGLEPPSQRVDQTAGAGLFGGGVRTITGTRVINWADEFSGSSLESFKQCVVELNNADRARAASNIQAVRTAKWSIERAMCSLGENKAPGKSTLRTLGRYKTELGKPRRLRLHAQGHAPLPATGCRAIRPS